jgi:hypothetical protein
VNPCYGRKIVVSGEKAVVTVFERPGKPVDSCETPAPVELAKCALSVADLLQPSSSERVSLLCFTCVQLHLPAS